MLDLETLGTRYNAMILSIGACYFDRETGNIGRKFLAVVKTDGKYADKFTVDYDTISWWLNQSKEARYFVTEVPMDIEEALEALSKFLWDENHINLWSHATFDIPILANAYETIGRDFPVPFRNMRDIRTLVDLSGHNRSDIVRDGTHHHALDDAKFQAAYCVEALQKLKHGS